MSGDTPCFAVVAGGGTAGHVLPALAVAEALVTAGHSPREIHYIGATRGFETSVLPDTPYPHTFYDVVGFQRRISTRNVTFLPKLLRAARDARRLFRRIRPQVVVSVGGYASMPAVLAARRLRIPVVVVSYDRHPGRASKVAARRAAACAVAFPDSQLPRAELTGAPVRRGILDVDRSDGRDAAREALDVPADRFLVAVMGGSLGSAALNTAITQYVQAHAGDAGLAVRHACGERFVADAAAPQDGSGGILYQVSGYEAHMAKVFAAADVFVGRGGASTVAEVAATGTPSILVPWPGAAEDHQTANVRWLSDRAAAVYLPESRIGELGEQIERLRHDSASRTALGHAAAELGAVHRSGALAALVERVASAPRATHRAARRGATVDAQR
jgi:UDP-N-acetylglucosamine--N-acetylmuramyl-(pentapeptide) pyrophosphoryl-undecaprenol N-acetylglucosamine transferase